MIGSLSFVADCDAWTGQRVACADIHAAAAALPPVPEYPGAGPDRFIEIRHADGRGLSIYVHPRESLRDALRTCAEELAHDHSLCFDSQGEEDLARQAVPALLAALGG